MIHMAFAGEVFGEQHVAGTKTAFATAAADLHRAEQRNHKLLCLGQQPERVGPGQMNNRRKLFVVVCAILTVKMTVAADYPIKPIRIIAPFPPASVADVLARPMAQKMAETW